VRRIGIEALDTQNAGFSEAEFPTRLRKVEKGDLPKKLKRTILEDGLKAAGCCASAKALSGRVFLRRVLEFFRTEKHALAHDFTGLELDGGSGGNDDVMLGFVRVAADA